MWLFTPWINTSTRGRSTQSSFFLYLPAPEVFQHSAEVDENGEVGMTVAAGSGAGAGRWSRPSACLTWLYSATSEADGGLGPAAGAVALHGAAGRAAAVGLVLVGLAEEAGHGAAVLPRHGVVEDGVDGGAQVEEDHRHHAAVLGERGEQRGGRVQRAELQVAAHVEGQPAEDEGEDHHHCGWNDITNTGPAH